VAFKQPLSEDGQNQLKRVLARRSRRFARKLGDFHGLTKQDQENVLIVKLFSLKIGVNMF
jgi:hypothetical protein